MDSIKMDAPKTQDFLAVLEGLKLADKKTLTVLPAANEPSTAAAATSPSTG